MKIQFTKMQGCGNDYIYVDCRSGLPQQLIEAIPFLSDRHFGVGGDGVICICSSDKGDGMMRMFNTDGSEGKMCGNGVRCVAQWLYEHGIEKDVLQVETLAGVKTMQRPSANQWKVDMGAANLSPASLPAVGFTEGEVFQPLSVLGTEWQATLVSMGNPHCVVAVEDTKALDLPCIGRAFETHPAFPESVNTEFIRFISPTELEMRVWERGSGETLACGTGACAAVAAFVARGKCEKNTDVTVHLLGGDLVIRVTDETVYMTGPAISVFEGCIEIG